MAQMLDHFKPNHGFIQGGHYNLFLKVTEVFLPENPMVATGTEFIDRNGIYYRTEICMKGVVEEGECILVSSQCDKIITYRNADDIKDRIMVFLKDLIIIEKFGKK